MKIGFDAKRIFNNATGLGVYGRNLVAGLQQIDHVNDYLLFTPNKRSELFNAAELAPNFKTFEGNSISSYYWRTFGIINDIKNQAIDIFHGLSNELPYNIGKLKTKSIVDIHDLCFVHFKEDYSKIDQKIFWHKMHRAAIKSDKIIATSLATKQDIISFFKVPDSKVEVVYQCCDSVFYQKIAEDVLNEVKVRHQLPDRFILSVGTIQGRKNQQAILQAVSLLGTNEKLPIVLVGNGGKYLNELKTLAQHLKLEVILKTQLPQADLPALYQLAAVFVYPSFVEGFGIPVLEAMASAVPVITSKNSSMAEIINNKNALITPSNYAEIADKIVEFTQKDVANEIRLNQQRAQLFSQEKFAKNVLNVYNNL